jgi:hypothetical protein
MCDEGCDRAQKWTDEEIGIEASLSSQQVIKQMKVEKLGDLDSEDEILQAAVNLTCGE